MSLFTRARRHVDMNRVKELREEKIKEETIAEVQRQQGNILAELKRIEVKEDPKYSNWRRELTEQMTTVDMGMVNLPGMGDANLADVDFPVTSLGSSPGYSQDGNNYTFGPGSAGVPPAETASLNIKMNSEKYDTIVFDFVAGTIDHKLLVITGSDGGSNTYELSNTTGRKELRLLPSDRKKSVSIAFNIGRDAGGGLGTNKMLNMSFRRVAPMNLVVGLDDPEANSFIRGGLGGSEERRKQLKDMLEAGNEWMAYNGLEPSKTTPGDIELAQGPKGFDRKPGTYHKNLIIPIKSPGSKWKDGEGFTMPELPSTPFTGPGLSKKGDDIQIAQAGPGYRPRPGSDAGGGAYGGSQAVPMGSPAPKMKYDPHMKMMVPNIPKAEKKKQKQKIMVAHHEPQYSNWRRELKDLSEQMTTVDMMDAILPPDPNTIRSPLPDTSLSSANNYLGSDPDENGVVFRKVEFEPIDATKVDTLTITISGSFGTKTIDGLEITDRVDIAQYVNGTYVGSFLAQELGNGTHTLTIPPRFRKANSKFEALQPTAFEGGEGHQTGSVSITGIGFKRLNAMPATVRLDDPEINSFIRMGDMSGLSAEERKAKLKDMLDAGNELMVNMGLEPNKTAPGDIELANVTSDARNPMGTGDQAALPLAAGLVASPMGQMALAAGAAAVATLLGITIQKAQEVVNQANAMNVSGTDYGAGPGRETVGPLPGTGGIAGGRDLTPEQQAEVEAAADELRDARRALNDLPADATDAQKDMAQERLDKATKNRQRVRKKHKQENQQRPRTDGG